MPIAKMDESLQVSKTEILQPKEDGGHKRVLLEYIEAIERGVSANALVRKALVIFQCNLYKYASLEISSPISVLESARHSNGP